MRFGVGGAEVTCGGGGEGGVEVGEVDGILLAAHRRFFGEALIALDSDFAAAAPPERGARSWAARGEKGCN
jgi:hypothetical protein